MPLAKCPRCGNMFNKQHSLVCTRCQPDEDKDSDEVRDAVEEHPNLNAEQIAEYTGVDLQVVMRLVEQGIVTSVTALESMSIKCGRCGQPAISASKKLCQACLEKLETEVARAQRKVKLTKKKDPQVGSYNMNVRRTLEEKRRGS